MYLMWIPVSFCFVFWFRFIVETLLPVVKVPFRNAVADPAVPLGEVVLATLHSPLFTRTPCRSLDLHQKKRDQLYVCWASNSGRFFPTSALTGVCLCGVLNTGVGKTRRRSLMGGEERRHVPKSAAPAGESRLRSAGATPSSTLFWKIKLHDFPVGGTNNSDLYNDKSLQTSWHKGWWCSL